MSSPPFRRALVVGLGQSGRAACALLLQLGAQVRGYDRQADAALPGIEAFVGASEPPPEAFAGIDLMVLSPGVPPEGPRALCSAHAPEATIHGELGLALSLLPAPRPTTVLITGTNGKSTVTALMGALLDAGGRRAFVGGNLGPPPADMTRAFLAGERELPEVLVLECSSFQLETLPPVDTAVAMLLNVTPDHLDRYATLEDYARTKARIFDGLVPGGLALLDAEDPWTERLRPASARLVGERDTAWIEGEGPGLALHISGDPPYSRELLRLSGRHNAKNALFALAAARHLGVDVAACREGLQRFEGLPHRMVLVRELDGVRWYDDSKATNVASALASLGGLAERFVLIAGGLAKGDDLAPLGDLLRTRGRGLVAIGQAAPQFHALAAGTIAAEHAADMTQAVAAARAMAQPGDVVVLAPACASFDQYRNYAHRGDAFTSAVLAL
jgi:UDP-N-acetylmuramoylalanine--D-glutamate ligase